MISLLITYNFLNSGGVDRFGTGDIDEIGVSFGFLGRLCLGGGGGIDAVIGDEFCGYIGGVGLDGGCVLRIDLLFLYSRGGAAGL